MSSLPEVPQVNASAAAAPSVPRAGLLWAGALVVVLALAGAALFSFGIEAMLASWETPEYNHAYMIPLVAVYLVWLRARDLLEQPTSGSWFGIAVIVAALFINLVGDLSAVVTLSQYSMVLAIWGLAIAAGGAAGWRTMWVPLVYLLFTVPLPAIIENRLTAELQLISSQLGVAVIRAAGVSVHLEGNLIDLGNYKLQVAEACSGLRYMFPLVSFGFLCAVLFRGPLWQRAVLVLSAIPITVLMNSFRIGVIGVLVNRYGTEQAEGFLHFFEGWVVFMACVGVLFFEVWLFAKLARRPTMEVFGLDTPPVSDLLRLGGLRPTRPFVAGVAVLFVASVTALFVDRPPPLVPERLSQLAVFPLQVGDWRGRDIAVDPVQLDSLKTTDYVSLAYTRDADPVPVILWGTYYGSQVQGASVHSPKACLPGGGWQILEMGAHPVANVLPDGQALVVNRALIGLASDRQLVYYWFPQRGRNLANEFAVKWFIFVDGLTKRRSDGSMVRIITPVEPGSAGVAEAEQRMEKFLKDIHPKLDYFLPGKDVRLIEMQAS